MLRLLAICLICVVGGGFAALNEARPFLAAQGSDQDIFERFVHTAPPVPHSLLGARITLSACLQASLGIYGRVQPTPRKESLAANCKTAAQIALSRSPADAFAHVVTAKFAFDLGLSDVGNTHLAASRFIAPYEIWLARWRWAVAEPRFAILDDTARSAYWQDVILLAGSYVGVIDVARKYAVDEAFRDRLDPVLEYLTEREQSQFFANVRRAMGTADE